MTKPKSVAEIYQMVFDLERRVKAIEQHQEFHTFRDPPENYFCYAENPNGPNRCTRKPFHDGPHLANVGAPWPRVTLEDSLNNNRCEARRLNDRCVKVIAHDGVHQGETDDCWN